MIWDVNNGLREAWKQGKWLRHGYTKMALAKIKWQAPLSRRDQVATRHLFGRRAISGSRSVATRHLFGRRATFKPRANGDPPCFVRPAISVIYIPFLLQVPSTFKHKQKHSKPLSHQIPSKINRSHPIITT